MKSCYVDIHIHTSENADHLNPHYDVKTLKTKIESIANGNPYLISLTDHNVINVNAYLELLNFGLNFVVGVELHIRTYKDCRPYHCHFLFDIPDEIRNDKNKLQNKLRKINSILGELYEKKMVADTDPIPTIQEVIAKFVDYDFLVLPHGGQSHSTFNVSVKSKEEKRNFDSVLERSLYYNLFDGFTSRSNKGIEVTENYFKKLGINQFINLVTCSDNYSPSQYPKDKNGGDDFIPTWMDSSPTFSGLRIALSEKSRLHYAIEPNDDWQEQIQSLSIENEKLDVHVCFEPGLNVVIGNSPSGKTLLVDSLYHQIDGTLDDSLYSKSFDLSSLIVINGSGMVPHYFSQNYILEMIKQAEDGKDNSLGDNELMKKIFPLDAKFRSEINKNLTLLNGALEKLVESISSIESAENELQKIASFYRIVSFEDAEKNPIKLFKATKSENDKLAAIGDKEDIFSKLDEVEQFTKKIAFCESIEKEIASIKKKINFAAEETAFALSINKIIDEEAAKEEVRLAEKNRKETDNESYRDKLLELAAKYSASYSQFEDCIKQLSQFNFETVTKTIQSSGHKLFVRNNLTITQDVLLETFNKFLKKDSKISSIDLLTPKSLFSNNFYGKNPKVKDYDDFKKKIYDEISSKNIVCYDILYKGKKHFSELSPGLKASVILDIILGYDGDNAPLIIDQPEDNLATDYINHGLISAIKKCKRKRQVIMVSHNATIPMLGDAQNVIVCSNDGKIKIQSYKMEDRYDDKNTILDVIANVTDGGKTSIKKRFKKYNMRSYRGDENENQDL